MAAIEATILLPANLYESMKAATFTSYLVPLKGGRQ